MKKEEKKRQIVIQSGTVIKEYDNDNIRFIRCTDCIIFQAKGGYSVVVTPRMRSLYEHLELLLDMKDNFEKLKKDEKKYYDALYNSTVYNLSLPIYSTTDEEFFFGISLEILERFKQLTDKIGGIGLQEEDFKENAKFDNFLEAAETAFSKEELEKALENLDSVNKTDGNEC